MDPDLSTAGYAVSFAIPAYHPAASKHPASGRDDGLNAALFDQYSLSGELADPRARTGQRHGLRVLRFATCSSR